MFHRLRILLLALVFGLISTPALWAAEGQEPRESVGVPSGGLLMRLAILPLIACLVGGCSTPPEQPATAYEIDRLVANLSTVNGSVDRGIFSNVRLPQTASPEEVIQRIFSMGLLQTTSYKILQIRQVYIPITKNPPILYTAVLVRTDSWPDRIVLFKYDEPAVGWWSRVYYAVPIAVCY